MPDLAVGQSRDLRVKAGRGGSPRQSGAAPPAACSTSPFWSRSQVPRGAGGFKPLLMLHSTRPPWRAVAKHLMLPLGVAKSSQAGRWPQ